MRNGFLFTAGIVGVLSSGVASRADVDYDREWNPYVTLRGGWLFGDLKYNGHCEKTQNPIKDWDMKKSAKSA